ncbi:hypothetical protein ASPWEDRAFT_181493 [Aspergillus wentii DTO 134E9]|uniref:Uncharacterized protein n=1 Tax=Aspergillus wentii DTO 134E9 TaxID=1073089 RepID=A0A1L9RNP3_ASPWE|nr:uncharacterized protein ASPWEDRAFT_181493 [Aspergillus wentii DTO 134E9]KAI9934363.1 hypothetical protein MW887_005440 [Aspergillus wentii]OJJ36493.1 hypothetical protein ASPWEDRAFT_181493 [Aspergillus wentii DTO 134E9]
MNWTGGRLQRHSNTKPGTLARVQKQNFAKSRSRASKGPAHASPFKDFAQFKDLNNASARRPQDSRALEGDTYNEPSSRTRDVPNNQPSTDKPPPSSSIGPSQHSTRLDCIKQQLLETSDWAGLAATRPLKMAFTSATELEGFGKRRKLTEADRRRLASSSSRSVLPPEIGLFRGKHRDYASSGIETVEDIDIRINGLRPGARSVNGSQSLSRDNGSSQPMLFDSEESIRLNESSAKESCGGNYKSGTKLASSQLLLTSDRGSSPLDCPKPISQASPSRIESLISRYISQGHNADGDQYSKEHIEVPSSLSRSSSIYYPPEAVRKRFTIDDQALEELQKQNNPTFNTFETQTTNYNQPSQQQPENLFSSQMGQQFPFDQNTTSQEIGQVADTQSCSSNQCSGWLPEPRYNIQRLMSSHDINLGTQPAPNPHNGTPFHAGPWTSTMKRQHASPITVFGQSVTLDDNGAIDETQGLMGTTCNPDMSRSTPSPQFTQLFNQNYLQPQNYTQTNPNQSSSDGTRTNVNTIYSEIFATNPNITRYCEQIQTPSILPQFLQQYSKDNIDNSNSDMHPPAIYGQRLPSVSSSVFQALMGGNQRSTASSSPDPLLINPRGHSDIASYD